jgi:hypothetical protein
VQLAVFHERTGASAGAGGRQLMLGMLHVRVVSGEGVKELLSCHF